MHHLKRNVAMIASTAVLGTIGVGGLMAAHADSSPAPAHSSVQTSGTTETNDGADQGPDANPNQPGHQDANETGESN